MSTKVPYLKKSGDLGERKVDAENFRRRAKGVVLKEGDQPSLVVLQQAWAPGWRITVDGAPRQSLRVGGVLLGAAVAAGDQQVTLRYRPDGWIAGQRMAIAGAALWLGLLLWARRRWRVLG